ncbi:MAG: TetR/AcrR family transcriptional regulator [Dehalococcoidia bacterium]
MNVHSRSEPAVDGPNREAIARAALTAFSQHGFHGATIKQIAASAGVSPGLVYWYFKDKRELFRAAVQLVADDVLAPAGDAPTGGSLEAQLTALANGALTAAERLAGPSWLLLADVIRSGEFSQILAEVGPGRAFRLVVSAIQSAQAEGRLPPGDAALAAQLFAGMLLGQALVPKLLGLPPPPDNETRARFIVAMFLGGASGALAQSTGGGPR